MAVGVRLLVACVVDLHGPWTSGGATSGHHRQDRGDDTGNFNAPPQVFRLRYRRFGFGSEAGRKVTMEDWLTAVAFVFAIVIPLGGL